MRNINSTNAPDKLKAHIHASRLFLSCFALQAEAAVASTLYLDPSIQTAHTPPKKTQGTPEQAATTTTTAGGDTERATGEEIRINSIGSSESRPAEYAVEAQTVVREGPVVVMSDANNYAGNLSPGGRQGKRGTRSGNCTTCCVG